MSRGTNFNVAVQQSSTFSATGTATKLVDANDGRIALTVTLPSNLETLGVVIAGTEADATAGNGELIGQDFSGNTNRFLPKVKFDTDTASQGEKWIRVLAGTPPLDILLNEYIA